MDNNMKAYLTVGLGFFVILILIVTSSFFGRREDPELVAEVQQNAEQYIEENFEEEMIIVDTFHDNADIYDQFYYAAIVEPANDPDFQFLVYKHNETDEYTDSYVAEVWEDELEAFLTPKIEELFGEDSIAELWLSY